MGDGNDFKTFETIDQLKEDDNFSVFACAFADVTIVRLNRCSNTNGYLIALKSTFGKIHNSLGISYNEKHIMITATGCPKILQELNSISKINVNEDLEINKPVIIDLNSDCEDYGLFSHSDGVFFINLKTQNRKSCTFVDKYKIIKLVIFICIFISVYYIIINCWKNFESDVLEWNSRKNK